MRCSQATVLAIPLPASEYSRRRAAGQALRLRGGRPADRRHAAPRDRGSDQAFDIGVVAPGDDADSMAEAFAPPAGRQPAGPRRSALAARAAAEAQFDWSVVGERIADEVLSREA